MKKLLLTFTIVTSLVTISWKTNAQGVSVNTSGADPDASAVLDVSSTTQGMLIPRMTAAQRGLIGSPATGLLVYQTDAPSGFYFYTGSVWTSLNAYTTVPLANGGTNANLSATGGAGQYLKQSSTGASITVGTIPYSDITGTPASLNLTGPISSTGNATSITSQTGTGTTFAMSASPALTGIPTAPTAANGTNTTQIATTAFVLANGASLADPTGAIGLTANNGSASTAMRSDATPALSQAIIPTWSGLHTYTGGITSTGTTAVNISNDATATTVNVGSGAAVKTVTVGSATGASATTVRSGTTGLNLNASTGAVTPTNIGTGTTTGAVSIGNATGKTFLPEFNAAVTGSTAVLTMNRATGQIGVGTGGVLIGIKYITTTTAATTFDAGTTSVIVEVLGGGGGGGGSNGGSVWGGGGGAGGYCKGFVTGLINTSTYAVTIGAAGAGATAGDNNGSAGGATTCTIGASVFTGNGGAGGSKGTVHTGGAGGTATGGSMNMTGASGYTGYADATGYTFSGQGGSSMFGTGGPVVFSDGSNRAGYAASGFGAGGSGASNFNNGSTNVGGAGTAGLVIIYEYR